MIKSTPYCLKYDKKKNTEKGTSALLIKGIINVTKAFDIPLQKKKIPI
jgi:hypothetical protein